MTPGQNLKIQINTQLQALVTAGVLGSYISQDSSKDPLTIDPPGAWPFAILAMPQIASKFEDNGNNYRTYRWDILFLQKTDNLNDGDLEGLIDKVLNQFDNNFTLEEEAQEEKINKENKTSNSHRDTKAEKQIAKLVRERERLKGQLDAVRNQSQRQQSGNQEAFIDLDAPNPLNYANGENDIDFRVDAKLYQRDKQKRIDSFKTE